MGRVGIVLVNYNGAGFQNDCIRTLYEMTDQDFDIILVDNASTDHSVELMKSEFAGRGNIHYLLQKNNLGVAAGNNIGIKHSIEIGNEYTMLLNNDTELDQNLLSELLKYADRNTVTVPKIYHFDNKKLLWFAGGYMDWGRAAGVHTGYPEIDHGQYDQDAEATYAPTCCMLIHNSIFDKVGFMDENFFMYADDTDFCIRLVEYGIRILYVHKGIVWHKVSSSSGGSKSKLSIYYTNRNRLYLVKKYKKSIKPVFWLRFIKSLLTGMAGAIKSTNNMYILIGVNDYLKGKMGKRINFNK